MLPCHWSQRATVAADLVRCYGALGRSIIFCETKRDCNELVASLGEAMRAQPLHGDIPQQQREVLHFFCTAISFPHASEAAPPHLCLLKKRWLLCFLSACLRVSICGMLLTARQIVKCATLNI